MTKGVSRVSCTYFGAAVFNELVPRLKVLWRLPERKGFEDTTFRKAKQHLNSNILKFGIPSNMCYLEVKS
jgi:hypothetical protein